MPIRSQEKENAGDGFTLSQSLLNDYLITALSDCPVPQELDHEVFKDSTRNEFLDSLEHFLAWRVARLEMGAEECLSVPVDGQNLNPDSEFDNFNFSENVIYALADGLGFKNVDNMSVGQRRVMHDLHKELANHVSESTVMRTWGSLSFNKKNGLIVRPNDKLN